MTVTITTTPGRGAETTQVPSPGRRYVDGRRLVLGAIEVGLDLAALLLHDSLASRVDAARLARHRHRNPPWGAIARNLGLVRGWIDDGVTVDEVRERLALRGVDVSERVLRQYADCYAATKMAVSPPHIDLTVVDGAAVGDESAGAVSGGGHRQPHAGADLVPVRSA
jgi:hypothetical protein